MTRHGLGAVVAIMLIVTMLLDCMCEAFAEEDEGFLRTDAPRKGGAWKDVYIDRAQVHRQADALVRRIEAMISEAEALSAKGANGAQLGEVAATGQQIYPGIKSVGVFGEPYHLHIKRMIAELEGLIKAGAKLPPSSKKSSYDLNTKMQEAVHALRILVHAPPSLQPLTGARITAPMKKKRLTERASFPFVFFSQNEAQNEVLSLVERLHAILQVAYSIRTMVGPAATYAKTTVDAEASDFSDIS